MKTIFTLVVFTFLVSCSGKIYTVVDPKPDHHGRIEGVIVYQPKPLIIEFETTLLQDKNGNIIGSAADKTCIPLLSYEITTIPDYDRQYSIFYDAALFESKKFSVELDKGVLTKLNNESTSASKDILETVKGIIGTGKEFVEAVKGIMPEGKPPVQPCNVGKKIVGHRNIADISLKKR